MIDKLRKDNDMLLDSLEEKKNKSLDDVKVRFSIFVLFSSSFFLLKIKHLVHCIEMRVNAFEQINLYICFKDKVYQLCPLTLTFRLDVGSSNVRFEREYSSLP